MKMLRRGMAMLLSVALVFSLVAVVASPNWTNSTSLGLLSRYYETGKTILSLLQRSCRERGTTVVIITHNAMIAPLGNRVIRIKNGGIESVEINEHPSNVEDIVW